MPVTIDPLLIDDEIVHKDGTITERFRLLWQQIRDGFSRTSVAGALTETGQNAALGTTRVVTLTAAGLYRISYYLRKTVADGVNSSAQVTLGWSDLGGALTNTFAALVLDTTLAYQGDAIVVRADGNADVTVAVAYASNTPGLMTYDVLVTVEPVS